MIYFFNSFILFIFFCIKLLKILIIYIINFIIFSIEYIIFKFFYIRLNFFYKLLIKIKYIITYISIKFFKKNFIENFKKFYKNFIKKYIYIYILYIYNIMLTLNGGDFYSILIDNNNKKNKFKIFYILYKNVFNEDLKLFYLFYILSNNIINYKLSEKNILVIYRNIIFYYILTSYSSRDYKLYINLNVNNISSNNFLNYLYNLNLYNNSRKYCITVYNRNLKFNNKLQNNNKFNTITQNKRNIEFKILPLLKLKFNKIYKIQFSSSNILKYLNKVWLENINIQYLRKNKIFNKGRYSRNRQTYRTGVYWCLYINIIAIIAFYFWFYKFSINFGYYWWFFYLFILTFFFSRSMKYKLYNLRIILNEFVLYIKWLIYIINTLIMCIKKYIYILHIYILKNIFINNLVYKKLNILISFIKYYILYLYNLLDYNNCITNIDDFNKYYELKIRYIYIFKDNYALLNNKIIYLKKKIINFIFNF